MARADSIVQTSVDNGLLTITVQGFAPMIVDPTTLPTELVQQAALHGFKQKYVDKAALGAGATPAEKHAAIQAMVTHHAETGDWNMTGQGDGTSGDGLLVRALMEVLDVDRDTARGMVSGMDKPTQAAMRKDGSIAPIIARMKAERPAPKASATVDTGAILAALRRAD
jgi:hypothetical protein